MTELSRREALAAAAFAGASDLKSVV